MNAVEIWLFNNNNKLKKIIEELTPAIDPSEITDFEAVRELVRQNLHETVFSIGDQFLIDYTNEGGTTYSVPWDVVSFEKVNGRPALWLESHYAFEEIQFDQNEGFYVVPAGGCPAGTYQFTTGTSWGSIVSGKTYVFTTTEDYAEGDIWQIGTSSSEIGGYDPSTWKIRTYKASGGVSANLVASPTETLSIAEGTGDTDLGTISSSTKYGTSGLNNLQRACYGYNRWSQSAFRQWLNSDAAVGEWWTPQNPYDRRPSQLATRRGFMAGLDPDFVSVVQPIDVVTALNTVSDSDIGTKETTVDKFFLAGLEQEYVSPQLAGEGNYWPYWKQRIGTDNPTATGTTQAERIRYRYDATTTAVYCRLRSALRYVAYSAWYVNSSGYVSHTNSTSSYRGCPACVIF